MLIGERSVHVVTCAFVAGMWDKFEGAGNQQYTPWCLLVATGNLLGPAAEPARAHYAVRNCDQRSTKSIMAKRLEVLRAAVDGTGAWQSFFDLPLVEK